MKKILIWVGAFLGLFVVLVGVTFFILSSNSPSEEMLIVEQSEKSDEIKSSALKVKQAEVDTLQVQLKDLNNKILLQQGLLDSLTEQINLKDGLISGYTNEIKKLNEMILQKEKQTVSVKELAKTYETMKIQEMKPILANLSNQTVISLYKNTSSKNRKKLFQALEKGRAAEITEILAGSN